MGGGLSLGGAPHGLGAGSGRRWGSPPSSRSRMFSALWTCTPSLLARACSRAVLPSEGEPVRGAEGRGWGSPGQARPDPEEIQTLGTR